MKLNRRFVSSILAAALAIAAAACSRGTENSQPAPQSDRRETAARTSSLSTPQKDPYANLFRSRPLGRDAAGSRDLNRPGAAVGKDRVVCGMVLHDVDPKVDPKIKMAPPNRSAEYAVRRLHPSACTQ